MCRKTLLPLLASFALGSAFVNLTRRVAQGGSMARLSMSTSEITADNLFKKAQFPEKWPFSPQDFKRQDESSDNYFYSSERFVHHIDDGARAALTKYYEKELTAGSSILDICSSWVSHYPPNLKFGRAVGLGMNKNELKANTQLSEFVEQDLNINPVFPFADSSFDFVTCVVSIDYLIRPLEVFSEIRRVLKPGGKCIISQSNRCFSTKAIDIWLKTNDLQHLFIIGCYFHFTTGFQQPSSVDITPKKSFGSFGSDPMFIVEAVKA